MVEASPEAAAPPVPPPLDVRVARHERRLDRLEKIADICVRLAEWTERQAIEANWLGVDGPKMILLIARAARQTTALEARLEREFDAQEARRAADAAQDEADRRKRIKAQVRRLAETMIDARAENDPPRAERLRDDLHERLDDPSIEDEFGDRSVAQILAGICADIGIAMEYEDWVDAEADYGPGFILGAGRGATVSLRDVLKAAANGRAASAGGRFARPAGGPGTAKRAEPGAGHDPPAS